MTFREGDGRPRFELSEVRDDGTMRAEVCSMREIAGRVGDVAFSRRSLWGLSALVGGGLVVACAPAPSANQPLAPKPTTTASVQPTSTVTSDVRGCGRLLAHSQTPRAIAFSHDGKLVATASIPDGEDRAEPVKLWDANDGSLVRSLDAEVSSGVLDLDFSPDGSLLAAVASRSRILVWTVKDGQLAHVVDTDDQASCLAFDPSGQTLAVGFAPFGGYSLWRVAGGRLSKSVPLDGTFGKDWRKVGQLAFSPDGKTLLVGLLEKESGATNAQIAQAFDPVSGGRKAGLTGFNEAVSALAFGPDGSTAAIGGQFGALALWRPASGAAVTAVGPASRSRVTSLGFDARDGSLIVARSNGEITVLDIATLKPRRSWYVKSADYALSSQAYGSGGASADYVLAAVSRDGAWLATIGAGKQLRRWDTATGEALASCSFDPDATATRDQALEYRAADASGVSRTYTLPCGSAVPTGAVCTCNCVPGRYVSPSTGGGGSGGSSCTCNKVCTCVPVRKYCFVMWRQRPLAYRSTGVGGGG